jgi:hypothetical protein
MNWQGLSPSSRTRPRWRPRHLLPCLALSLAGSLPHPAWAADEAALKAAIVYNLLQFVQWPAEVEAWPAGAALGLCADRLAPLWPYLMAMQGRAVRQWQLDVRATPAIGADLPRHCQAWVLEPRRLGAAQAGPAARLASGKPVLTVGDGERADEDGVVVGLTQAGGRIVFDVDLVVARANQLRVSFKVLRLARGVRE